MSFVGKNVVLVLFGSFSPITIAHLRTFEIARDTLLHKGATVVKGIITPVSDAYGKKDLVSITHRTNMINLAIKDSNWIEMDTWEGFKNEFTPSCTVLKYLRDKWSPEIPNLNLRLVCGSDLLKSFTIPGLWTEEDMEEILRDFGVSLVLRHGTTADEVLDYTPLIKKYSENILISYPGCASDVSSTQIRTLIRERKSIKYLTPEPVVDYLNENRLY